VVDTNKNKISSKHPVLDVRGVTHSFDYPLFSNVDLTLNEKESIAIMGTSGSGKSTLLNIFSTLLKPDSGEVYYNNQNIFTLSNKEILELRKNAFGIIFQSHYLFRGFNGVENLHISELLNDTKIDDSLIIKLKIDHILHQGIGELSGGQQQRLSTARVLTKKPKVIFADEPTGNLDKKTAIELIDILFEYIQQYNASLMIVTHEKDIAFRCDSVYELIDHKLERIK